MPQPELLYPHENLRGLIEASKIDLDYTEMFPTEITTTLFGSLAEQRIGAFHRLGDIAARTEFALFNGHTEGAELGDKTKFTGIMRDLGYRAARSTLVLPGSEPQNSLERIAALDYDNSQRFLKPRFGKQAKGTMIANTPDQALGFVNATRRPYLVQTLETPSHEWRYALHRDAEEVKSGAPHGWRIAFRKSRASLVGDGETSFGDLVRTNPNMPQLARLKFKLHKGYDLDRIPKVGEHIEFAIGGNIGARLPTDIERENLDNFMVRLSGELEKHIGRQLATICFDVGAQEVDTLTKPYDYEQLREQLIFYEYQVPFSFTDYAERIPFQIKNNKLESRFHQMMRAMFTLAVFNNSMYASGKTARKLSKRTIR